MPSVITGLLFKTEGEILTSTTLALEKQQQQKNQTTTTKQKTYEFPKG